MVLSRIAPSEPVQTAIARASAATGVPFAQLVETARRESGFQPTARASGSTATGLFQFIERTWLETVRQHGSKHGLGAYAAAIGPNGRVADPALRRDILALREDPETSARMGAELAKENVQILGRVLGRAPTVGEVYVAHVLGPSGAARLIAAADSGVSNAASLFPTEARANPSIFFASDSAPRSAGDVLAKLAGRAGGSASQPEASPESKSLITGPQDLQGLIEAMIAETLADLLAPTRGYGEQLKRGSSTPLASS